jgi:hypothetical protein
MVDEIIDGVMVGGEGLDKYPSRIIAASRALPRPGSSNWKVLSAARKSGRLSDRSASNAPTTVTPYTSWPLVIICVPTSMSSSAFSQRRISCSCAPLLARRVAIHACRAGARKKAPQNLFDLLGAGAHAGQRRIVALWTDFGGRAAVVAMMTGQKFYV